MIDVAETLYGMGSQVYEALSVPAEISTGIVTATIRVIDDTKPRALLAGSAEVRGVLPGAFARMVELAQAGVARDDFVDSTLTFNGRSWLVRSYELRGSPRGEDLGEVRFLLAAGGLP